jgi:hypothetical protein
MAGANLINTRHPEYGDVFRIAVEYSDLEIIQLLLSFDADANSQDQRNSGVLQAAVIRLSTVLAPLLADASKRKDMNWDEFATLGDDMSSWSDRRDHSTEMFKTASTSSSTNNRTRNCLLEMAIAI